MTPVYSLRARLVAIILVPLGLVASAVGYWELKNAERTANDVFDRSLLVAALAVAKDVAVSDGDALSPVTAQLLENSSGGLVFYHVYAPDGVIVAGYATPPVGIPRLDTELAQPLFFDATYLGQAVSGVRLQTQTEIEGFSGIFTTTVWQDRTVRTDFVADLVTRTMLGLGAVLMSLAVIVWFGVRLGLRPLTDLEDAIARRSSDDLSTIRRAVPEEVRGLTDTLNRLFQQVEAALGAQSTFIANAAHQLRNPIAGILSLAEATVTAQTPAATKKRAEDLLDATRKTAKLTEQLLLHERSKSFGPTPSWAWHDAQDAVNGWVETCQPLVPDGVALESDVSLGSLQVFMDEVMLNEALNNLVTNAVLHGGPTLTTIRVAAWRSGDMWSISVEDDGRGIPKDKIDLATTRFAQVGAGEGSGLGLSITQQIALSHGGAQSLTDLQPGLKVTLDLLVQPAGLAPTAQEPSN